MASVLALASIAVLAATARVDGGLIVALGFDASSQMILKADPEALYRSGDGGHVWIPIPLPAAAKGHIASVAISGKGKGALYIAGPAMGVLRTEDGGRTWAARNKGLPGDKVIALAVHTDQPDTVYASVSGQGIFRSEDAGRSWRLMDKGPRENIVQFVHSNMPGSMQTGWLFAATSKGVSRAMDCFCGWRDAGGLSGKISAVSYDPSQPRHVYAATSNGVFLSANGGEEWTKMVSPPARITALLATPSGALYAATRDGRVYRSADRGNTWEQTGA